MLAEKIRMAARTLVASSLILGSAIAAPVVIADDHDDDDDRFGTYIYAGTIDDIENARVVEDIDELERDDDDDLEEHWRLLGDGQDMPDDLYTGDEDLDDDIDLETLTSEPHMVVVHETEDRDSAIVAVGVIEGEITGDGTLLIQLDEYENSGWEGRAWFGPEDYDDDDDDDDDELEVVVGVYPAGSVDPLGTPEAIG
jgi:hypothetical protein